MTIDRKWREIQTAARHTRMSDKRCTECGSPIAIVDPANNSVAGWCLCGDKAREQMGRPQLWEVLIAMGEDAAAHELIGDPFEMFEPVTDAVLESDAQREAQRRAERTRTTGDLRRSLDERFGLSG